MYMYVIRSVYLCIFQSILGYGAYTNIVVIITIIMLKKPAMNIGSEGVNSVMRVRVSRVVARRHKIVYTVITNVLILSNVDLFRTKKLIRG